MCSPSFRRGLGGGAARFPCMKVETLAGQPQGLPLRGTMTGTPSQPIIPITVQNATSP